MKKIVFATLIVLFSCISLFSQDTKNSSSDSILIKNCALDYADGFYSGDAVRMERALHPDLNKISIRKMPQTGKHALTYSTVSILVELSRAKSGFLDPEKRKLSVVIFDINNNTACAKVNSAMFNDYLQLIKIDGQWKIINVLWENGPDSPARTVIEKFDASTEANAASGLVVNYEEGINTNDVQKVEATLHPEFVTAQMIKLKPTEKYGVIRNRYSGQVESIRAKLRPAPNPKPESKVKVFDCTNGMAFIKSECNNVTRYYQMFKFDDAWKILNGFTQVAN